MGRTLDRTAATAPARAALRAKFAREVDPDGTLDPAELERRVDCLIRSHMLRMSLAARTARRKARELTEVATAAEREMPRRQAVAREPPDRGTPPGGNPGGG